jgi:hypothetical protein
MQEDQASARGGKMRGSRFDYCGPRIRIAAGDGAARGHWFSALSPSRKSRLPSREHGLDLRPPHLRNGGNWSLSIPAKTPPAGPPPPFFGGPCCRQAPILFDRQILSAAFSFGLVVGIQVVTVCAGLPCGIVAAQQDRGLQCTLRGAGCACRAPRCLGPHSLPL